MNEQNTGQVNQPGTYRDPQSGAESTVSKDAGADALVRLGWVRVQEAAQPKKLPRLPENL